MTKLASILAVIDGTHPLADSLATYHVARHVRDAARMQDDVEKFTKIKRTLHSYNVMVSLTTDGQTRIFRPDTKAEVNL